MWSAGAEANGKSGEGAKKAAPGLTTLFRIDYCCQSPLCDDFQEFYRDVARQLAPSRFSS